MHSKWRTTKCKLIDRDADLKELELKARLMTVRTGKFGELQERLTIVVLERISVREVLEAT